MTEIIYPAGAMLRVRDICTTKEVVDGVERVKPGLLPVVARTWLKWVEQGKVPKGVLLGKKTRAWPIEVVQQVMKGG